MAHPQQMFFVASVKQFLPEFFRGRKVLEVGSLNINGSVRPLFEECDYLGLDVGQGPGVDLVCRGEDHGAPAGSYDVVISCEMMEHNPNWRETWLNMIRLLRHDGLMVMTCASRGRRRHGTPDTDPAASPLTVGQGLAYYRNLEAEDFSGLANLDAWFPVWAFFNDDVSHDLYFLGVGREAPEPLRARCLQLKAAFADYYRKKNTAGEY
ncbi:MAG: methyltransferase domain-containing protein [Rhodocyclaceae bacterium]|nr:methyltransferase domain-containing protein [Rhodocyclaceae bacterium]